MIPAWWIFPLPEWVWAIIAVALLVYIWIARKDAFGGGR